jgi:hypothetical protein
MQKASASVKKKAKLAQKAATKALAHKLLEEAEEETRQQKKRAERAERADKGKSKKTGKAKKKSKAKGKHKSKKKDTSKTKEQSKKKRGKATKDSTEESDDEEDEEDAETEEDEENEEDEVSEATNDVSLDSPGKRRHGDASAEDVVAANPAKRKKQASTAPSEGGGDLEVCCILARSKTTRPKYYVHWFGFDDTNKGFTWEPPGCVKDTVDHFGKDINTQYLANIPQCANPIARCAHASDGLDVFTYASP